MYKKFILLCVAALCLSNFGAFAQQTVIWLVRHAEKQASAPGAMASSNPALSEEGSKRAADLASTLKSKKISAIYSTNYIRTVATAAPLAKHLGIQVATYDARNYTTFAAQVLQENKGKEILIVGHSNTLIPLAKALNAQVPFDELTDDDYDMLFKITVDESGRAKLTINHYGVKHHTTAIPAAYAEPLK